MNKYYVNYSITRYKILTEQTDRLTLECKKVRQYTWGTQNGNDDDDDDGVYMKTGMISDIDVEMIR